MSQTHIMPKASDASRIRAVRSLVMAQAAAGPGVYPRVRVSAELSWPLWPEDGVSGGGHASLEMLLKLMCGLSAQDPPPRKEG